MKIKEVEKRTGISSANIRFYEKEGLLTPKRSKENNYRDYTEQDVERLEKIKILRLLGISIEDIKSIYRNERILEEVITNRIRQLHEEEKHVKEVRKACENILLQRMDVSMLGEQVLGNEKTVWRERLQQVLKEDTTKVWLDKKALNRHIAVLLLWGYGISLIVTLLVGGYFLTEKPVATINLKAQFVTDDNGRTVAMVHNNQIWIVVLMFLMIMFGIIVRCSSGIVVQGVVLHITAIMFPILLSVLSTVFFGREYQQQIGRFLPIFWVGAIVYVLVLWFLAEVWDKMFTRDKNAVGIAIVGAVLLTGVSYPVLHEWQLPAIMFSALTIYIGLFWTAVNTDNKKYNRYYAVMSANRILNPVVIATSYRGKAASGFWR